MSSSSRTSKQRKSWLLACLYFKFTLVKVNKKYFVTFTGETPYFPLRLEKSENFKKPFNRLSVCYIYYSFAHQVNEGNKIANMYQPHGHGPKHERLYLPYGQIKQRGSLFSAYVGAFILGREGTVE